jgi:hypothetical protein
MGNSTEADVQINLRQETAWHSYPSAKEVLAELGSSENGLSASEAESRLARYGRNALTPPKKPGFFLRLWYGHPVEDN